MKKLILLVIVVCLANNLVFWFFHLPRFWGVYYDRFHFYEANALKYNTLLIGSSVTRYSVDPVLFDSLNAQSGKKTHSFDLGVDGACPTELFSTYQYILSHKPPALNNVFVELTLIDNFDMGQLHSLRRKSSFDISQYIQAMPLTLQSNYPLSSKTDILYFDLCHVIENTFKIDMLKDAYDFDKKRKNLENIASVDDHVPLLVNDTAIIDTALKTQTGAYKSLLEKHLADLSANTENARTMFKDTNFLKHVNIDYTYIKMVHQMLDMARQSGITLVFFLPPRFSKENYEDLLPVYYSIPTSNRIQLADANEYPDFYKITYSYDKMHINQYAVPMFTKAMANSFLKLEKQ